MRCLLLIWTCRRPTFMPAMKLKQLDRSATLSGSASRATVANFVNALADLDGPKRALAILDDTARLEAFECGIRNALREQPGLYLPPPPLPPDLESFVCLYCSSHPIRCGQPAAVVSAHPTPPLSTATGRACAERLGAAAPLHSLGAVRCSLLST